MAEAVSREVRQIARAWRVVAAAAALTAAMACASPTRPTAPTAPVTLAELEGRWSGEQMIERCDYPNCGQVGATGLPPSQPIGMTLSQTQGRLTGTLELGGWYAIATPVTADLDGNGVLVVSGGVTWNYSCFGLGPPTSLGRFQVNRWRALISRSREVVHADVAYTMTKHLSSCYYSDITAEGVATLRRVL